LLASLIQEVTGTCEPSRSYIIEEYRYRQFLNLGYNEDDWGLDLEEGEENGEPHKMIE
jgi:hypothetical protein